MFFAGQAHKQHIGCMKSTILIVCILLLCATFLTSCARNNTESSGDPVKADPKHYTVEFENNHIRVLRARYGPHEKSPMHSHPANVVITLRGGHVKEIDAAGRSSEDTVKAQEIGSGPAKVHSIENLGDDPYEVVVIELKD